MSVPHLRALNTPGQFASGDWVSTANPPTTYAYDGLKRMLTRVQPDGTSTFQWSYSGFATTASDENGHQKVTTTDALGRLASVKEYTGTNPSVSLLNTTLYTFDVADNLLTVVDQAGNTTTLAYDTLGRKITMSDPDRGSWSWTYPVTPSTSQPLWLVATQTDAKGQ